ncbi:macro domain-containing protein [Deferribacter autotrophicus]|uniref:Macro domain-containing protein n=1 Tax=Deferribacter autotrophicus TaxID=500465 RepID=A0A5A8F385_9BACT|nr:macro domain-containing protein [Deferribacter autotrophicus]KAA0257976.1 macro domain-containing protein [Deferribacter autotrophicus]
MERKVNEVLIIIKQGDITKEKVDAIVNAANSALKMGGGVAGAIRKAGGEKIQQECDKIGYCPLGDAVVTNGGKLYAKYVVHAVGPRYGIDPEPEKNLYNAVYNSLKKGEEKGISSIALPAISTGIFGYPLDEAAEIILKAVKDFCEKEAKSIKIVVMCLFSDKDLKVFEAKCREIC